MTDKSTPRVGNNKLDGVARMGRKKEASVWNIIFLSRTINRTFTRRYLWKAVRDVFMRMSRSHI